MTSHSNQKSRKKGTTEASDDGVKVFRFDASEGESVDLNTPGLRVRATKLSKKEIAEAERRFTARL